MHCLPGQEKALCPDSRVDALIAAAGAAAPAADALAVPAEAFPAMDSEWTPPEVGGYGSCGSSCLGTALPGQGSVGALAKPQGFLILAEGHALAGLPAELAQLL